MISPASLNRRSFLAGAGAVIAAPGPAMAAPPRWPAVQRLLEGYVAAKTYAGVAVALSYRGEPAAFPAAGTLAYDSTTAVGRESLFRIYSVTKPLTGIAAMLLVEEGRIALDQPVADALPELREMRVAVDPANGLESRPASQPMTMRQLLTHTSGLSNWQPALGNTAIARAYRERGITPGSFVRQPGAPPYAPQVEGLVAMIARLPEVPLIAEPGTAWNYSLGLDVMGAVIERVSGMTLDRYMRQRLFDPLGMRSTGFQVAPANIGRLTTLYGNTPDGPVPIDRAATSFWLKPPVLPAGGGGLVSSTHDLLRFGQMLLGDGMLGGIRVAKPKTIRTALSNLLPPGIAYPATGGFGAGAGVVMPGVVSDNGPVGSFSAVGASSTAFSVDPARRGVAVFLAQFMPGPGVKLADATRYRAELNAAIEEDLAAKARRH